MIKQQALIIAGAEHDFLWPERRFLCTMLFPLLCYSLSQCVCLITRDKHLNAGFSSWIRPLKSALPDARPLGANYISNFRQYRRGVSCLSNPPLIELV